MLLIGLCTPLEVTALLVEYTKCLVILLSQSGWLCTSLSVKQSGPGPQDTKGGFARCISGCPCTEMYPCVTSINHP